MKEEKLIQFKNCRIVRNNKIVKNDYIWVRNGKIVNPEKIFFEEQTLADVQINCRNAIIAPGFIDLQINGGYGIDFSHQNNNVEKGIDKVAKELLSHGVTAFCPTIVTSPRDVYHSILPKILKRRGDINGATILGIHVEGPFINPIKKGAHPQEYIKTFPEGFKSVEEMYGSLENVKILTLAPELKGSEEVISKLSSLGVTVSLGHSMGNLCDGERAVKNGASLITHLFNAMLPFHHRDSGLVGLLTSEQIPNERTMYFGIISDGVHTHPSALRIAHRTRPDGLILVTDAISAMGLADGLHHIGQLDLEVRCGKAFIAGTDTLCGSIAPMDECIRIFKESTKCSTVYAIDTATIHPARCLNIESEKGSLHYGADADFVFLGDDLNVWSTWIAGECVYMSNDQNVPQHIAV